MPKLAFLKIILVALIIFLFCACVSHQKSPGYSMAQATGAPQTMTPTAGPQAQLPRPGNTARSIQRLNNQSLTDTMATNLPDRIVGGKVVRSESGLIVVQSSGSHDSLLPTDLTTDAIITSSVLSNRRANFGSWHLLFDQNAEPAPPIHPSNQAIRVP